MLKKGKKKGLVRVSTTTSRKGEGCLTKVTNIRNILEERKSLPTGKKSIQGGIAVYVGTRRNAKLQLSEEGNSKPS